MLKLKIKLKCWGICHWCCLIFLSFYVKFIFNFNLILDQLRYRMPQRKMELFYKYQLNLSISSFMKICSAIYELLHEGRRTDVVKLIGLLQQVFSVNAEETKRSRMLEAELYLPGPVAGFCEQGNEPLGIQTRCF
jgi:hypothetical protein